MAVEVVVTPPQGSEGQFVALTVTAPMPEARRANPETLFVPFWATFEADAADAGPGTASSPPPLCWG